ncbi:MAG TPA: T9SS type A sorting domain-containing protein, partial [Fibrella sp.]
LKNVNRRQSFSMNSTDTLTLTASWPGNVIAGNGEAARYVWSNGQTGRTIRTVNQAGTFRVTDGQGCLTDEYTVTIAPRARLTTNALATAAYCPGSTVTVTTTPENLTLASTWLYDIQLSDATGNFTTARTVGSGTLAALTARLPADLSPGPGYRLRVVPRDITYADVVAGPAFTVQALPTASVTGSSTALIGQPASATVSLTGDAPWQLTFSNGTNVTATTQPVIISFTDLPAGVTRLTNVSNACGAGTVLVPGALTGLLPTAVEPDDSRIRIYPNPTSGQVWVDFLKTETKPIDLRVFDSRGSQVVSRQLGHGTTPARIAVPLEQSGLYFIQIRIGDDLFVKKVLRQP